MEPARTAYIYLGDELRSLADRVAALERAAQGVSLASWHELTGIADEYDCGAERDIAAYLRGVLSLGPYSRTWYLAPTLPLEVSVSPYTWEGPTADIRESATADVILTFPDGSTLTKAGVRFLTDYNVPGRVYAARLDGTALGVETGLTMDYSYRFVVEGCGTLNQCVLVGAYTATTERTTLRIMGNANRAQCMWPGNIEVNSGSVGIDFRQLFRCDISASRAVFTQGTTTYTSTYSGTASGTGGAPILLLNDEMTTTRKYGVDREVRIYAGDGTLLRCFQAANLNGEIVFLDAANNNTVYRPSSGALVEVEAP